MTGWWKVIKGEYELVLELIETSQFVVGVNKNKLKVKVVPRISVLGKPFLFYKEEIVDVQSQGSRKEVASLLGKK